jgi:S-adenosylmethionine synthetase
MANKLTRRLTYARKQNLLPYLMPDAKVQVGVQYDRWTPQRIHSITLEVHTRIAHKPDVETIKTDLMEAVVTPVFDHASIAPDNDTEININPNGPYLGGPLYHSGLTGRKCAVDTYGEYARHSGKALSGKDPLRVDRIGVYAARYAAKNVVAAGLANACEVMVSYATGAARPVSLMVNTFGTGTQPDPQLAERIRSHFDFRPAGILKQFALRHLPGRQAAGFFQKLSANGHVGREDLDLPWERTDMF